LNGDTLYVFTNQLRLMAWDIARGMLIGEKSDFKYPGMFTRDNLVTVRAGILLQTEWSTFELWNFNLSECIRSWSDFGNTYKVTRISEERVACNVLRKVIILDTTMEGIMSTVTFHGDLVACNSKCHAITANDAELRMQCGDVVLWEMSQPFEVPGFLRRRSRFSPSEQHCVLAGRSTAVDEEALYVLDAVSGRTLHKLCHRSPEGDDFDSEFVSDSGYITNFNDARSSYCIRLFNVKSGDLLCEIDTETKVYSLAAYPRECLIAIGFRDSKVNFKLLQVKLPGDKHSRKNKRSDII